SLQSINFLSEILSNHYSVIDLTITSKNVNSIRKNQGSILLTFVYIYIALIRTLSLIKNFSGGYNRL
ncbi:MAG: hypothetical protein ACK2U3_13205, partial [Anaerolineales bacterium]